MCKEGGGGDVSGFESVRSSTVSEANVTKAPTGTKKLQARISILIIQLYQPQTHRLSLSLSLHLYVSSVIRPKQAG